MLFSLSLAMAVAVVSATGPYYVHKHSSSPREAAWSRTVCGSPNRNSDIITSWGNTVNPNNVHPEYPRPQMTRDIASTFTNLNGLWEFQLANGYTDPVPYGQTLNQTILVPFPLEACLSGAFAWPLYSKYMWYRVLFDTPASSTPGTSSTLLHFGAVDWNSTFYLNGKLLGNHIGGYDNFLFDITSNLVPTNNELIVFVYDPSDTGYQPHGKQRISAISNPGGDTYTPSSGIWQTVWLETVPSYHISNLKLRGDLTNLYITVNTYPNVPGTVNGIVTFNGNPVTTFTGDTFTDLVVPIPNPQLWSIGNPNLYDLNITVTEPSTGNIDSVGSYFGMRTVSLIDFPTPPTPADVRIGWDNAGGDLPGSPFNLNASDYHLCWAACNQTAGCNGWSYGVPSCGGDGATPVCWLKGSPGGWTQNQCRIAGLQAQPAGTAKRPAINGKFTFLAGWLDQSWWPDGEYTAPTDAGLEFDVTAIQTFGLNAVRLHQKVNPQRWYYFADKYGIAVLQDGVQKYGGASEATIEPFLSDFKAMMDGLYNHPSIIQWDVFNEEDCVGVFPNVTAVIDWVLAYDPSRLVDTNSGGPANGLYIADVNDDHSYPWPGDPSPSATQYALDGEFGGIGAFIPGMEWANNECGTYLPAATPQIEADIYVNMTKVLISYKDKLSGSIYTQITDVENECDGFYTMNRTNKFTAAQLAEIVAANNALIST